MNILHSIILMIGVTQLVRIQAYLTPLSSQEELEIDFYFEINSVAEDACLKLQNISKNILEDEVIKKSSSVLIQDFKKNITKFHEAYPFYLRFGHNETILITFSNIVKRFQEDAPPSRGNKDFLYIKQLLNHLGVNEIWEMYKKDYQKMLVKFGKMVNASADKSFTNWLNHVKECKEYECYLLSRQKHYFTTKEQFEGFLQKQLTDMTIQFVTNSTHFIKRIFKELDTSQLSPFLKDKIKKTMQERQTMNELLSNIYHIFWVPLSFDMAISFYANMEDISLEEMRLIIKFLHDQGYEKLMSDFRANYDYFLQHDLLKEYEHIKQILSPEELSIEKDFWSTFENLKKAATLDERTNIVNAIDKDHFRKFRI